MAETALVRPTARTHHPVLQLLPSPKLTGVSQQSRDFNLIFYTPLYFLVTASLHGVNSSNKVDPEVSLLADVFAGQPLSCPLGGMASFSHADPSSPDQYVTVWFGSLQSEPPLPSFPPSFLPIRQGENHQEFNSATRPKNMCQHKLKYAANFLRLWQRICDFLWLIY